MREWSEVTRPSADCQTTSFRRFKQLEKYLKKVVERSRDSGRRSRDRRLTVKQRFLNVSSNLGKFRKKSLNGHARVVGGHATIGRLSNNVFRLFKTFSKKFLLLETSKNRCLTVGRQPRDLRPLSRDRSAQLEIFLKKVAERSRDSGRRSRGCRPTVNNDFSTFQAIRNFFGKSR